MQRGDRDAESKELDNGVKKTQALTRTASPNSENEQTPIMLTSISLTADTRSIGREPGTAQRPRRH